MDWLSWLISNWTEALGFVTGLASVWLFARQSVLAWPVGIVASLCWLALFVQAGLYADSGLQVFYVAVSVWGWWHWLRGEAGSNHELAVARTPTRLGAVLLALALGATAVLAVFLTQATDSAVPAADAATTVLSLIAYYLIGRKYIENWPVWIFGVNLPYVALYLYKGLALTAALQPVFIALSIRGWVTWSRELRRASALTNEEKGQIQTA